jgi:hypothetical protein
MKVLKSKLLHVGAACLAATIYFAAPISVNATTILSSEVSTNATGEIGYSMYISGYQVTWIGNVEAPKVYRYDDNAYKGWLDLQGVTYNQRLNVTTAVYGGYVYCFGTCPPPS